MVRLELADEELERVEADAMREGPHTRVLEELAGLPADQGAAFVRGAAFVVPRCVRCRANPSGGRCCHPGAPTAPLRRCKICVSSTKGPDSMTQNRSRRVIAVTLAAVTMLAAGGGVALADAATDTTITVSPRTVIPAPQNSPVDFAGVARARAGQPLPAGYVAVARAVAFTRGTETAFAAMRMTCPKGTSWRSGGADGDVGASVLDRRASGKRSVLVMASPVARGAAGEVVMGTVYALCR